MRVRDGAEGKNNVKQTRRGEPEEGPPSKCARELSGLGGVASRAARGREAAMRERRWKAHRVKGGRIE